FQVDSLEKLAFISKSIVSLHKIATELDYELVMVTNQDGLGTASFPEETFWPAHNKMLQTFEGEGIIFTEVLIDCTFEHENAPTRKPRTGLLEKYLKGDYDLASSYVIGDRKTDIQLAQNLGAKAIYFSNEIANGAILCTSNWEQIYQYLKFPERTAHVVRNTSETNINIDLNIDGTGKADIQTGLGFFDHMLEQIARHGNCDLKIKVDGDLHIDEHHTVEDTALALGEAFLKALSNKKGIYRYGFLLPMDESLAQVAIDFSGRNWLVWEADFKREKIGEMPTEMFYHFFKSFTDTAKCNLNIKVEGKNEHHKIEAIFKAFAKAIRMAVKRDPQSNSIPSTKGTL
ncbi:MAG: bifunctional histidinol-phosphatase/imidazoleglycerol-phosphate dehydratase HisB, partial [Bacteroidota bacterium]